MGLAKRLTPSQVELLVAAYPVLRDIPRGLRAELEDRSEWLEAPAGSRLFEEGGSSAAQPLLVSGAVRVVKTSFEGDEILLYRLEPGEICVVTALALLGRQRFPATAMAEQPVSGVVLAAGLFEQLVLECAEFRLFVFGFLSARVARLMTLVEALAFRGISQRLALRLLELEAPLQVTHQALADELGTRREVVSRVLKNLQNAGMLRLGRKRIEIADRRGLSRYAGPDGR